MESKALARKAAHENAKPLLLAGNYSSALAQLESARREFGENVQLSADIAACHFLDGKPLECRRETEKLESTARSVRAVLQPSTLYAVNIVLAKLREEEGELAHALALYRETLASLDPERDAEFHYLCLAQILRMAAQYGLGLGQAEYYSQLTRLRRVEENYLDRMDLQHALLLADYFLVGENMALARLGRILEFADLQVAERNLVIFDLAEAVYRREARISEALTGLVRAAVSADAYERALQNLVLAPAGARTTPLPAVQEMGTANRLRYFSLAGKASGAPEECRRAVELALAGISAESRRIWTAHFYPQAAEGALSLTLRNGRLESSWKSVELGRQEYLIRAITALAASRELGLDDFCRALWDAVPNMSYQERARAIANRLNSIILKTFGIPKALRVRQTGVSLSPEIRLGVSS